MKAFIAIFAMAELTAAAPALPAATNKKIVENYLKLVRKGDSRAAGAFIAPKIIWQNQNHPNGKETFAGAYAIYLNVSDALVGPIKSIECRDAGGEEVSCDFVRLARSGNDLIITEHYFVMDGKIAKIVNTLPPAMLELGKQHG